MTQGKVIGLSQTAVFKTAAAVICVSAAVVLSTIFHVTNAPGMMFLPMHLPILLCAFICGAKFAGPAGFVTPFLVSLIPIPGRPMGMPPPFPVATAMAFELAAYGAVTGFVYWLLFKGKGDTGEGKRAAVLEIARIVIALVAGMVAGRLVFLLGGAVFFNLADGPPWSTVAQLRLLFFTGLPGIAVQLAVIPAAVFGMRKYGKHNQSDIAADS